MAMLCPSTVRPLPERPSDTIRPLEPARRNRRVARYRELVRPLAVHYARCSNQELEDLIQVGLMGLMRAAEGFDDSRQDCFPAYARSHIRGAILHYLRDQAPVIRLPRRQVELEKSVRRLEGRAHGVADAPLTPLEIAARLGMDAAAWQRFERNRQLSRITSLEGIDRPDVSPSEEPENRERRDRVARALNQLEPCRRRIVAAVVMEGRSLRQVGAELGISPMTVQRRLKSALAELARSLADLQDWGACSEGAAASRSI
ncbi:sigma-70 family RNA polymerase sigma factor [Synechococcus sp. RSCCF101]|uniref:sigma-70 family RNA polymerase sigma factor n=1 Tax=Synechococcus sp. RSCCF101 TaxID=2511069 RepID=UPI001245FEEA|nr:sigma-70 family RNA polymerase sigma factor [Synechococcus sp. RSCCF101]QEY31734.1 sigma-70 family RNA polymerase sigma factor [Synechococcus sp. RSCCF101]